MHRPQALSADRYRCDHLTRNDIMIRLNTWPLLIGLITLFAAISACDPDDDNKDCNNLNVIENTYTGDIDVNSFGLDPSADFEGNNDSGIYSFEWCNPQSRASLDFEITPTAGGSVRMILRDHAGEVVLDKTRPDGGNDSFSGVSDNGINGTWTVEVILSNVNGDGSWSMSPGE